jgi:hypothetical protein
MKGVFLLYNVSITIGKEDKHLKNFRRHLKENLRDFYISHSQGNTLNLISFFLKKQKDISIFPKRLSEGKRFP